MEQERTPEAQDLEVPEQGTLRQRPRLLLTPLSVLAGGSGGSPLGGGSFFRGKARLKQISTKGLRVLRALVRKYRTVALGSFPPSW